MFITTNAQDARVTHGRYRKLVHEADNITVEWEQGYLNGETFIPLGCASKCYKDAPAVMDEDGVTIVTPAVTAYTDLVILLPTFIGSGNFSAAIEAWLASNSN